MTQNLFKSNLDQKNISKLKDLKQNIVFCARLVRDLEQVFNVTYTTKRRNELELEITVYEPKQHDRFGFGFCFTATNEGVSFRDERGLWLKTIASVLNVKVSDDYNNKDQDFLKLNNKIKKINGHIGFSGNSGCGDHYHLILRLNESDSKLDNKIKLIIAILKNHSITTKLDGVA